jgi:hypothetical protein
MTDQPKPSDSEWTVLIRGTTVFWRPGADIPMLDTDIMLFRAGKDDGEHFNIFLTAKQGGHFFLLCLDPSRAIAIDRALRYLLGEKNV